MGVSNVVDVNYDKDEIKKAIVERIHSNTITPENIYGSGDSGKQIAEVLVNAPLTFHKTIVY